MLCAMDAGLTVYTAAWCTVWKVLARQLDGSIGAMVVVDVDEDAAAADRAQVAVVPTFIAVLPDGRMIKRHGAVSAEEIETLLTAVKGKAEGR